MFFAKKEQLCNLCHRICAHQSSGIDINQEGGSTYVADPYY